SASPIRRSPRGCSSARAPPPRTWPTCSASWGRPTGARPPASPSGSGWS
ncbi:MAG: hypothetical protein AVDCRST_MAG73-639, partial [uncultured Thermomicrobiales bacterium]